MCNLACLWFVEQSLVRREVEGKRVIDVGSRDVNGSARPYVTSLQPSEYIGVDIEMGPGVDRICNVTDLAATFGHESFDIVISTEMLEHVWEWRGAINNMKRILKPGGILILTTRSPGFPRHDYPSDWWRFTEVNMRHIFSDFTLSSIQFDSMAIGIFVRAVRPLEWAELDLFTYEVPSVEA